MDVRGAQTQKAARKIYIRVIGTIVRDTIQGQKMVPRLLELIMSPSGFVKDELRRKAKKTSQFRHNITKSRFALLGCPEISRLPAGGGRQEQSRALLVHVYNIPTL